MTFVFIFEFSADMRLFYSVTLNVFKIILYC